VFHLPVPASEREFHNAGGARRPGSARALVINIGGRRSRSAAPDPCEVREIDTVIINLASKPGSMVAEKGGEKLLHERVASLHQSRLLREMTDFSPLRARIKDI
jgi:hypothetical protein